MLPPECCGTGQLRSIEQAAAEQAKRAAAPAAVVSIAAAAVAAAGPVAVAQGITSVGLATLEA